MSAGRLRELESDLCRQSKHQVCEVRISSWGVISQLKLIKILVKCVQVERKGEMPPFLPASAKFLEGRARARACMLS